MDRLNPKSRRDAYGSRINRDHSPLLLNIIPWASILIGCILPVFAIISTVPLIPPMGFIFMIAWRLVRPGMLPVWAGFPIGMFDDLFSGQPFGSGILFFSLAMVLIEALDTRFPWRSFWQDWLVAALAIIGYLLGASLVSGAAISLVTILSLGPQIVLSILIYPFIARLVAGLDRLRLMRVRVLG